MDHIWHWWHIWIWFLSSLLTRLASKIVRLVRREWITHLLVLEVVVQTWLPISIDQILWILMHWCNIVGELSTFTQVTNSCISASAVHQLRLWHVEMNWVWILELRRCWTVHLCSVCRIECGLLVHFVLTKVYTWLKWRISLKFHLMRHLVVIVLCELVVRFLSLLALVDSILWHEGVVSLWKTVEVHIDFGHWRSLWNLHFDYT